MGLAGCSKSEPLPPTYPVKGKVVYMGGAPVTGDFIEFRSSVSPQTTMMGNIQVDGSFELSTVVGSEKLSGGIAGPCQVTVNPPIIPGTAPVIIELKELITIEPKENYFTIEIPPERSSK